VDWGKNMIVLEDASRSVFCSFDCPGTDQFDKRMIHFDERIIYATNFLVAPDGFEPPTRGL